MSKAHTIPSSNITNLCPTLCRFYHLFSIVSSFISFHLLILCILSQLFSVNFMTQHVVSTNTDHDGVLARDFKRSKLRHRRCQRHSLSVPQRWSRQAYKHMISVQLLPGRPDQGLNLQYVRSLTSTVKNFKPRRRPGIVT